MLHDARNLVGTIGLYCDLLAMPGVLKPEHSQYPEELRHLGARSGDLIDALMRSLLTRERSQEFCPVACASASDAAAERGQRGCEESLAIVRLVKPISLREIVERRSGLLRRVANGRTIEVEFGPAAAAPVRIAEEDVERILVNLVRNATAATEHRGAVNNGTVNNSAGGIRITLGVLASRVGGTRPWPFQRVRLSVEDSGCGMTAGQVEWLLSGSRQPSSNSHGIGFHVVRELAGSSDGDLQVMSAVESGTRVQIEWPVAAISDRDLEKGSTERTCATPLSLGNARSRRLEDNRSQVQMEGTC
jgi:signal transduction histidine kinase